MNDDEKIILAQGKEIAELRLELKEAVELNNFYRQRITDLKYKLEQSEVNQEEA